MPTVWIPPLMRSLSNNQTKVVVAGQTVRQVIENLEQRFPGMMDRLMQDGQVKPGIAVAIDGEVNNEGISLRTPVDEQSEIHFVPAISGGMCSTTSPHR